jgi:hypothetical protein
MVTEYPVAPGLVQIAVGDVVCMTSDVPQVRRAAQDIIQAQKTSAIGIALSTGEHPANPKVAVATAGSVDKTITGLPAGNISIVIVDPATGRLRREANPTVDDVRLGVCDEQGNVALLTRPLESAPTVQLSYLNVADFGAIPNDSSAAAKAANVSAFILAQEAMGNPMQSWGRPLFVPPGVFYLDASIHIRRSLELFGTGLFGESVLQFDRGAGMVIEPPTLVDTRHSGVECLIRDLQIKSDPPWSNQQSPTATLTEASTGTAGIKLLTTATIQRVYIQGFTGTGIYIDSSHSNCNQWRIHDVFINTVGGHGVHTDGREAQGGFCSGVKVIVAGGNGFFESSFGGNTYVGCYAEEIDFGRGYYTDSVGQVTFVGCASESRFPSSFTRGGTVWIGGNHGGLEETQAFVVQTPLGVLPFEMPNLANNRIKLLLGYKDPTNGILGFQSADEGGGFWLFRWLDTLKAWSRESGNSFPSAQRVSYQTGLGHARGQGLYGLPSMLLGPLEEHPPGRSQAIRMEVTGSGGAPPTSGPYKRGDIIFNSPVDYDDPTKLPQNVGWVCTEDRSPGGLVWKRFGRIDL